MLRLGLVGCLASRGMWRGCEGCWRLRDIRSHFNACDQKSVAIAHNANTNPAGFALEQ